MEDIVMKWTPVTEKLPPKDGSYFIVANFKNKPSWQAVAWYNMVHNVFLYTGGDCFFIEHQTHWMELPPPPELG